MIRKIFIAILLIVLFTYSTITAQAHEAVDLTMDDCSLTIEMKYDGNPVAGGTLTLYRVGDIVENNGDFGFEWKDNLNCSVEMENLESKETATKVLECVKLKNMDGDTVNVDDNGQACFKNLEVGLYLIEQKTAAKGYTAINSFLVSLPRCEDGHYVYSIIATAKVEMHMTKRDNPPDSPSDNPPDNPSDNPPDNPSDNPPDNPSDNPPDSPSDNLPDSPSDNPPDRPSDNPPDSPSDNPPDNTRPTLPKTGQLNWPIPLLAVFGVAFLAVGFILRRRKNDA